MRLYLETKKFATWTKAYSFVVLSLPPKTIFKCNSQTIKFEKNKKEKKKLARTDLGIYCFAKRWKLALVARPPPKREHTRTHTNTHTAGFPIKFSNFGLLSEYFKAHLSSGHCTAGLNVLLVFSPSSASSGHTEHLWWDKHFLEAHHFKEAPLQTARLLQASKNARNSYFSRLD